MNFSKNVLFGLFLVVTSAQISLALIGDSCSNGRCNEDGAFCSNGFCACPTSTTIVSPDRTKCLLIATSVGSGCESEFQCSIGLTASATCDLDLHQCKCKPEAAVVDNICKLKKFLGDSCTSDQECRHVNQGICNKYICTCNIQFVPASNNSVCLSLPVSWQSTCEESIQCSSSFGNNAICKDMKMCACKENFHPGSEENLSPLPTTCVQNRGVNERCERPDQCYLPRDGDRQNMECVDTKCQCKGNKKPSQDNQSCNGAGILTGHALLFWAIALVMASTIKG